MQNINKCYFIIIKIINLCFLKVNKLFFSQPYINLHINTSINIHAHMHANTYIYIYMYTYIHPCTHKSLTNTHTYIYYTRIDTQIQKCHTCIHIYIYRFTYTHSYRCIQITQSYMGRAYMFMTPCLVKQLSHSTTFNLTSLVSQANVVAKT